VGLGVTALTFVLLAVMDLQRGQRLAPRREKAQ
jgi:hypothetical protein